ncbi:MAG TPA: glycosyltransferase family 2 protein [Gaiellaceae bacterium]|nr:glycosyltransferase family 2 protein [Gaiellaceae bacterium]
MSTIGRVSVVVPLLDEARKVERLVADIAGQDFEGELEILVADGGSTDGTVELLTAAAEREGLPLQVLPNPERLVAPALNLCIARATGDLIVRLDAKSSYPSDYVRRLARAAEETGAENVGALVVPTGTTAVERAAAAAMASPFGGIMWWREGSSAERVEVDTVYCGAFRPEVFRDVGLFDAAMGPDHDEEFNLRLRETGGRIVLDPSIRANYTPVGTYRELWGKYYNYGFFKPRVMAKHRQVASVRSLVPPVFVASLAVLVPLATRSSAARRLLALQAAAYVAGAVALGADSVRRRGEPWSLLPAVVAAFATFHVAFGVGFLRGLLRR